MGFFYIDRYYLFLVLPMFFLAILAQMRVKSSYSKYRKIRNSRGLTGAMAAQRVLDYYNITNVRIERIGGELTDNFDPRINTIRLSEDIFDGNSIASVGIACHEAGHAAQHAENYAPVKIRNSIISVCNIGSFVGIPLAIIGLAINSEPIYLIGLFLYAFVALFQLVTLPVEFNASARAVKVIEETGLLSEEENKGAKSVLKAAAMTYVAALAVSLANLLRIMLLITGRRRR